jgi:hypothetical protein
MHEELDPNDVTVHAEEVEDLQPEMDHSAHFRFPKI